MIPESVNLKIHDLDIVSVISDYVALKRKGRYYECCCPFHYEKTPSFKVNPSKNTWFCYGACQEGGDAIAFVMKKECCSYPEAVKIIANNHGIHYVEQEYSSPEEENKARKRDAFFAAMVVANDFYTKSFTKITKRLKRLASMLMGVGERISLRNPVLAMLRFLAMLFSLMLVVKVFLLMCLLRLLL